MKKITVKIDDNELDAVVERVNGTAGGEGQVVVTIAGERRIFEVEYADETQLVITVGGQTLTIPYAMPSRGDYIIGSDLIPVNISARDHREAHYVAGALNVEEGALFVNMPGKIVAVEVAVGDTVEVGQGLVIVEAMKMENELKAGKTGTVSAIHVAAGDTVVSGALLLEIED